MSSYINRSWNRRNVDFSNIHGTNQEAYSALFGSMDLKQGMIIGDLMSGYGDVSKIILNYCKDNNLSLELVLLDAYAIQLERSKDFLIEYNNEKYSINRVLGDIRKMPFLNSSLDIAIVKMGLHELPKNEQNIALQDIFRVMKPQGKLFVWHSSGLNPELAEYWRKVVRKKDELAGYNDFVRDRYLMDYQELTQSIKDAGFIEVEQIYDGDLIYETKKLAQADFNSDKDKLNEWNKFLRRFPNRIKGQIDFKDNGNSISVCFRKRIYQAKKNI